MVRTETSKRAARSLAGSRRARQEEQNRQRALERIHGNSLRSNAIFEPQIEPVKHDIRLAGIAPYFPLPRRGESMSHVSITRSQAAGFVERMASWFAEWRQAFRDAREQAEMRRKLNGVDEHLLRDMGLRWSGRHLERIGRDENF